MTREASRAGRHEFVGKRGAAIRAVRPSAARRPESRPDYRSIVSGLRGVR
ncbi:hypothetical protein BSLA_01f5354 [Burkholderia stabilis]|nr:hypothetical protein BSLA_01f5354 [Burkholderia stabilis]